MPCLQHSKTLVRMTSCTRRQASRPVSSAEATSFAAIWNGLHALRYAGILDRIAGMVVGAAVDVIPVDGGPDHLREVVLDVLGDRDIPVIGNVNIGHKPPNIPLPLGVRTQVDADALTISLLEAAVS